MADNTAIERKRRYRERQKLRGFRVANLSLKPETREWLNEFIAKQYGGDHESAIRALLSSHESRAA